MGFMVAVGDLLVLEAPSALLRERLCLSAQGLRGRLGGERERQQENGGDHHPRSHGRAFRALPGCGRVVQTRRGQNIVMRAHVVRGAGIVPVAAA